MDALAARAIVLVSFPFSDLSHSKLRPAVVLAYAEKDDWILCQVTSKSYGDSWAIKIEDENFEIGSLHLVSYVRPGKLFTANSSIIKSQVGKLKGESFEKIIEAVVKVLNSSIASDEKEESEEIAQESEEA
ncbi:MAG: type II toxin-antitoxin system PemK/MazF family toxin [Chloroflexi bacterium]|nr:type II toxin-antitoxin system PemK/MazF family toxin [Chloroflexota bacterium]